MAIEDINLDDSFWDDAAIWDDAGSPLGLELGHRQASLKTVMEFARWLSFIVETETDPSEDFETFCELDPECLLDGICILADAYNKESRNLDIALEVIEKHKVYEQKLLEIIKGKYPNHEHLQIGGE